MKGDSRKVLVTPRSVTRAGHSSLDSLRHAGLEVVFCEPGRQPGVEELKRLLPGCEGYLAGIEPITAEVLESANRLRVISRNGTGVDNIDLAAAEKKGIKVLRADGANARGVAELAFGLLLATGRRIAAGDAALKRQAWNRGTPGVELYGRTLGIIGCGNVGKLVTRIGLGFGMKVLAYDPFPDAAFAPGPGFAFVGIEQVVEGADVISLHCPPSGKDPVLNAELVSRLKDGVYLINTARYDLWDVEAILRELECGRIAGIGMDVFDEEPPKDTRLIMDPRVVATAHLGGFTQESIERAMYCAVEGLLDCLARTGEESDPGR